MTKELRELPLFYGSQTVSWEEDGCTNQLHRLVLAINRGAMVTVK